MNPAAAPLTLDDQLRNFGGLVGLVLVFVVLFTNQRWAAAEALDKDQPGRGKRYVALVINFTLIVVTAGLFATGLPLVFKALEDPQWLRVAGAIRDAFVLVWLLMVGLLGWQGVIVFRSIRAVVRSYK